MKIKKLVITLLVILSLQMFGFEPKLDYNVTRSENYKISEQKMKKESLEVKNLDEQIKMVETMLSNLENSM